MRTLLLLTVCGLVSACAIVSEVKGPDGRTAYAINCGTDRASCLKEAGERCPTGYNVVDDNSTLVGVVGAGGFVSTQNLLTISCRQ